MPSHATKTPEEASGANREAFRGGVVGAAKVRNTGLAAVHIHCSAFSRLSSFFCSSAFYRTMFSMAELIHSGVSLAVALLLLASSSLPSTET